MCRSYTGPGTHTSDLHNPALGRQVLYWRNRRSAACLQPSRGHQSICFRIFSDLHTPETGQLAVDTGHDGTGLGCPAPRKYRAQGLSRLQVKVVRAIERGSWRSDGHCDREGDFTADILGVMSHSHDGLKGVISISQGYPGWSYMANMLRILQATGCI
jgi:hypothetical protein